MHELIPHARKAAQAASRRWDIEADDTFQTIMLDAWGKISRGLDCDEPIALLRSGIRFSIGHEVTARYYRRGRGETDQFGDDFDAADDKPVDLDLKIDLERAMKKLPKRDAVVIKAVEYGYSMRSLAELAEVAHSTMVTRLEAARGRLADAMAGREVKARGEGFTLIHEDGLELTGGIAAMMRRTGLSKGSISNLRTGKAMEVKGWRLK